jgi:hypothetical protein
MGAAITLSAVAMFLVVAGAIWSVFSEPRLDRRHTVVEPEPKGDL